MKIAVMIMAGDKEPSLRNIPAMQNTFIAYACRLMAEGKLKHEYDFWFYTYGSDDIVEKYKNGVEKISDHVNYLHIHGKESIYNTFEKTMYAYDFLTKYTDDAYDWYIRINISAYLNILLLDKAIDAFAINPEKIYCNVILSYTWDCTPNSILQNERYNDLYPRGDFMCFTKYIKNEILKVCDKYIRCDVSDINRIVCPHVDDVLTGLCIMDAFGKTYFERLQMLTYNFIPQAFIDFSNFNDFAICNRIKTSTNADNGWNDTPNRQYDTNKFYTLQNYYNKVDTDKYNDISMIDLVNHIYQPFSSRINPVVRITYMNTQNIVNFLKNKRKC